MLFAGSNVAVNGLGRMLYRIHVRRVEAEDL